VKKRSQYSTQESAEPPKSRDMVRSYERAGAGCYMRKTQQEHSNKIFYKCYQQILRQERSWEETGGKRNE